MLVLSRKESEQIVIGKDTVVTVMRISGNRVRLAIEAPQFVRIWRAELRPYDEAPAEFIELDLPDMVAEVEGSSQIPELALLAAR